MIGVIGVGDIGLPMTGHVLGHGFDVIAYDVDPQRLAATAAKGAQPRRICPNWVAPPT
jgi:3-hydroxyisobutyrate dehydrogenase-like beta-hydroxyacid dehydrogenase